MAANVDVAYFCSTILNNMKTSNNIIFYEEPEGPDKGLPDGKLISIKMMTIFEGIVTARPSPNYYLDVMPSLVEWCGGFSTFSCMPRIELKHDNTRCDFGRAYYTSCDYQFTEFHFTLYSVDELKQQIEAWERQYEESYSIWVPARVAKVVHDSRLMDLYFAERPWAEELHAWVASFKAGIGYTRYSWAADGHSCRPYHDRSIYLHHLVNPSLCGRLPQARVATRLRCRSSLMASCHEDAGNDLLGH